LRARIILVRKKGGEKAKKGERDKILKKNSKGGGDLFRDPCVFLFFFRHPFQIGKEGGGGRGKREKIGWLPQNSPSSLPLSPL